MRYIELFEGFKKDYVNDSIKDILVELQDSGMEVEVWHWIPNKKESKDPNHKEAYNVWIHGSKKRHNTKKFNTNILKEYIDTISEFMKEFCPDFEVYFEYYDRNEQDIGEGETLELDKVVGSVAFTYRKK